MKILKKVLTISLLLQTGLLLFACSNNENPTNKPQTEKRIIDNIELVDDKYRNYYEIFVWAFNDTNNDGIGDLKGVTAKLDYIKDLGYNGIWLMPICKGTSYHKYDTIDYYEIDPQFGSLNDFKELVSECHKRDIKLITDLVVNHTSVDNEWFKQASAYIKTYGEVGGEYGEYFNFATGQKPGYNKLNGTNYYYESQFWSGMPDLNLDSTKVRNEIKNIMQFWFQNGVDGFRLDAVTYYYTNDVNKNVEFLSWLNTEAKKINEDAYIVGEAWINDNSLIRQYYNSGIDSFFCFPLSQGSGLINTDVLSYISRSNASSFNNLLGVLDSVYDDKILAPFISNHDTTRIANFCTRAKYDKIRMSYGILSLMKGAMFSYYGEEIGMLSGANSDDPSKRLPILWDTKTTDGYCKTLPPGSTLDPNTYSFGSVTKQLEDKESILNYYKYANYIRNANPEIARGTTNVLNTGFTTSSGNISVFQRTYNGKTVTVVVNLTSHNYEDNVEVTLDMGALNISSMTHYLCTDYNEDVTFNNKTGVVNLPPYSYAIFR